MLRENTDREMATFLTAPMALPDPYVQALFSEGDWRTLAIATAIAIPLRDPGRNCGRITRMGQRLFACLCQIRVFGKKSRQWHAWARILFYAVKALSLIHI